MNWLLVTVPYAVGSMSPPAARVGAAGPDIGAADTDPHAPAASCSEIVCSDIAGSQGLLAGVRVLVVEDDESCRIAFARLLAVEGAAVATAASAREGLDVFREVRPHVVISDLILPDEDGCWLIRRILAVAGERPRTIVVTAVMHPSEQTRCFAAGFEVFLLKPVEPRLLCGLVARLAREPRPGAGGPAAPGRP